MGKSLKHNTDKIAKQQLHGIKDGSIKKNKDSKFKNTPVGKVTLINKIQDKHLAAKKDRMAINKNLNQSTLNKSGNKFCDRTSVPNSNAKIKQKSVPSDKVTKRAKRDSTNGKQNFPSKVQKLKNTLDPKKIKEKHFNEFNFNIDEKENDDLNKTDESDTDTSNILGESFEESEDNENFENGKEGDENDDSNEKKEMVEHKGIKMFKGLQSKIKKSEKDQENDDSDESENDDDYDDDNDEDDDDNDEDDDDNDEDDTDEYDDDKDDVANRKQLTTTSLVKVNDSLMETDDDDQDDNDDDTDIQLKTLLEKSIADDDDDDDDEDFNAEDEDTSNDEDDDISSEENMWSEDEESDNAVTKKKKNSNEGNDEDSNYIFMSMKYGIPVERLKQLKKRLVIIDNVSKETTKEEMLKLCRSYGKIDYIDLKPYPVLFRNSDKIEAIHAKTWLERDYSRVLTADVVYETEKYALNAVMFLHGMTFKGNYLNVASAFDDTSAQSSRTVWLKNLKPGINANPIMEKFCKCGYIKFVKNIYDEETGISNGSAFVTFIDEHSANVAARLNGTIFMGRQIEVSLCSELAFPQKSYKLNEKEKQFLSHCHKNREIMFKKLSEELAAAAQERRAKEQHQGDKRKESIAFQGQKVDLKNKKKKNKLDKKKKRMAEKLLVARSAKI